MGNVPQCPSRDTAVQPSVAQADAEVASGGDGVGVERDAFWRGERFLERHGGDDGRLQRDHIAELAFGDPISSIQDFPI